MSSLQQGNLGDVLRAALQKLHQEEHFDKYLAYLNSEWYYTADDLRLARNDEKVWGELKFPGRLKIEIATVLDDSVTDQQQESSQSEWLPEDENAAQQEDGEATTWVKCWAAEHECYYFYNMVTQESSWEDPQADANVAYDVYQYNDATQEWEVIEDNTSTLNQVVATEPYKNPYSLSDESPMDSPKASASQKTIFKAESKWSEEKMTAEDAKSSQGTSATDTAAAAATTFTRPRSTPRNDSDDRLFVESPNRPKMLKSLPRSPDRGDEFQRNYKYSIGKKNSPARSTPPRKTGDTGGGGGGGQGSGGSQASLLARRAPGGRRVKPVRLNTSEFSSESDSDSQQTSPVAHNVRTHTNTNVKPLDSSAAQKGSTSSRSDDKIMLHHPRRHSPMMSKPVGRPVGAALSPQHSPKSGVSVSLFDAEAKEGPNGGAQYDWDSKNNETVDSSTEHDVAEVENNNNNNPSSAAGTTAAGAAPAGVAAEEEPYDFYKDYTSTDAEYVPPSHFNQKRYMSAIDIANSRWYENAEEAHLPENYLKGAYIDAPGGTTGDDGGAYYDESQGGGGQEGFYDENGDYYTQQQYDESAKTYYDYAAAGEGGEYKDSDYEYPEDEYYNNPEGASAGEEEYEDPAGEYTDEYYGEYDGAYAEGEVGGGTEGAEGAPVSSRGIAEEERAYENSYYNHVTTPSAPPADHTAITSATTAPIAAFSPHSQGVTATASQKQTARSFQNQQQQQDSQHSQWSGRSGTSGYSPFNDYKSESPGNRTSPTLSPIATPINSHRHTFVVEATAEEGEGEGEDLMALAMGSPATPGGTPDQPPAKVKQRSTLSKLFRMNLFKKGPTLPSTPPPPRDPSSGALDPHSSAYRHQKMLERKAAKQNAAKNSSTSGGGSGGGGGDTSRSSAAASDTGGDSSVVDHSYRDAILNCDEVTAHSSFGGNIHGERLRRKPAPAPADSTNAVNARQKFYAAHAQTQHYKYHDRIASLERKRASGRGGGGSGGGSYASKQEEIHYRNLQKLLDMGFDEHESIMALSMCGDDLNDASQMLIEERDR